MPGISTQTRSVRYYKTCHISIDQTEFHQLHQDDTDPVRGKQRPTWRVGNGGRRHGNRGRLFLPCPFFLLPFSFCFCLGFWQEPITGLLGLGIWLHGSNFWMMGGMERPVPCSELSGSSGGNTHVRMSSSLSFIHPSIHHHHHHDSFIHKASVHSSTTHHFIYNSFIHPWRLLVLLLFIHTKYGTFSKSRIE